MVQTVYVLEILRPEGVVRGHFAQSLGAAQRAAAGKYRLAGHWQPTVEEAVVSVLVSGSGGRLARVVKERLDYG